MSWRKYIRFLLFILICLPNIKSIANSNNFDDKYNLDNPYYSKEMSPKLISFENLKSIIIENNEEYKAALERFNQSVNDLQATLKLKYPTIDLQSNGLPSYLIADEYRNPDYNNSTNFESSQFEASISTVIKWDIIDPERTPEIEIKRLNVEKSRNALNMTLQDLILRAQNQYYQLQSTRAKVNTAKIMLKSSKKSLDSTIVKNKALVAPDLEVYEAETQLLRDKRLLNNAHKNEAEAIRALSVTLGFNDDYYPISNDQISIKGLWNSSLDETKKSSLIYNEKLKELDLEIKITDKQIKKSNALIKPKFSLVNTLTGSYKLGQDEVIPPVESEDYKKKLNNTIALTTQWRIFDAGRSKELKKKSISRKKEYQSRYENQNKEISKSLEDIFTRLISSKKDIFNSYLQLKKQEEILNISEQRFKAGVTNQREIINNQRDLLLQGILL